MSGFGDQNMVVLYKLTLPIPSQVCPKHIMTYHFINSYHLHIDFVLNDHFMSGTF